MDTIKFSCHKNLIQKILGWQFLGWSIAIGVTIWFSLPNHPYLYFEILGHTNVAEVKEDVTKLDILYDGKSLKKSGKILKVINIRVGNKGRVAIHQNDYTQDNPLGLTIDNGELIETPQIIESSSDYLKKYLKPTIKDSKTIVFAPAIINSGQWVSFKMLILCPKDNSDVDITPLGTIANVDKIVKTQLSKPTYVQVKVGWPDILASIFLYIIGSFFILGFVLFLICKIVVFFPKRRLQRFRQLQSLNYRKEPNYISNHFSERMLELYVLHGYNWLAEINQAIVDISLLKAKDLNTLISNKILTIKSGNITINDDILNLYKDFLAYLQKQKATEQPNKGIFGKLIQFFLDLDAVK